MFVKLATMQAVVRRETRRFAKVADNRIGIRVVSPEPRRRPVLRCRWQLDPASGRPVCIWEASDAGSSAAVEADTGGAAASLGCGARAGADRTAHLGQLTCKIITSPGRATQLTLVSLATRSD